jgi:hypothetical protein
MEHGTDTRQQESDSGFLIAFRENDLNMQHHTLTVIEGHAMMAVARLVRGPRVTNVYCNAKGYLDDLK